MSAIVAIAISAFSSLTVFGQDGEPLQVDIRLRVKRNQGLGALFEHQIAGGAATLSGRVHNLPGGETALVMLQFDYRTNAKIALDEIVSRIIVSIEDSSGNEFSIVAIDPNTIPLNPNRVPLHYSATLYTPKVARGENGYIARVQVYGNYE